MREDLESNAVLNVEVWKFHVPGAQPQTLFTLRVSDEVPDRATAIELLREAVAYFDDTGAEPSRG